MSKFGGQIIIFINPHQNYTYWNGRIETNFYWGIYKLFISYIQRKIWKLENIVFILSKLLKILKELDIS